MTSIYRTFARLCVLLTAVLFGNAIPALAASSQTYSPAPYVPFPEPPNKPAAQSINRLNSRAHLPAISDQQAASGVRLAGLQRGALTQGQASKPGGARNATTTNGTPIGSREPGRKPTWLSSSTDGSSPAPSAAAGGSASSPVLSRAGLPSHSGGQSALFVIVGAALLAAIATFEALRRRRRMLVSDAGATPAAREPYVA